MTFDKLFPDASANAAGGAYVEYDGSALIKVEQAYGCSECGNPTTWLDLSFQAPLCSEECNRRMWQDYAEAYNQSLPDS